MSLIDSTAIPAAATGYDVDNSCKFEKDNSERLARSYGNIGTPTNADKFTLSIWLKRTELQPSGEDIFFCGNAGAVTTLFGFQNDVLKFRTNSGDTEIKTNRVFRDTASWYHIMVVYDSTDSTEANRVKFYVNGVQETSLGTANYPTQNADSEMFETNMSHYVGSPDGTQTAPGYYTELYFLDGQVKQPTDFGEFDTDSGIWIPKAYDGSFGDEGYYLDFEDGSNLGLDVSGNSNNFNALYNISAADQSVDTCTNNFATWLSDGTQFNISTDNETFKEGGTQFVNRAGTGWTAVYPTQSFAGGKWYMEVKVHSDNELAMYGAMPVARINNLERQNQYHGQDVDGSIGIYGDGGQIYYGTAGSGGSGSALSAGDIIGLAIDMENYKMYFAVNNTYVESGNPAGNSNGRSIEQEPYVFSIAQYSPNTDTETNFGGYTVFSNTHTNTDSNGRGQFVYQPPSGFLALCSKNLGETGG